MIIRVFKCTVIAGKEAEFREIAFTSSHPALKNRPGLRAFYAGRPIAGSDDRSRVMVQIWDDLASIRAANGDAWDKGMELVPAGMSHLVDTASVEHFELADEFHAK